MSIRFLTAREIWDGYQPSAQPLCASTISTERNGNIVCTAQRFSVEDGKYGHIYGKLRTYLDSRWADGRAAVLLIPDLGDGNAENGDNAMGEIVQALVSEGYVVGVPDYADEGGAKLYPAELSYAVYPECKNKLRSITSDAKATCWYVWCKALRRAMCALEQLDVVIKGRIGVIGIGVGAQLAWMLAGTDSRVKAVVPISGGGYLWTADRPRFQYDNVPASDEESAFSTGVGAETYARFVTCPTFFITSRMSRMSDVDRAGDILNYVKSDNKQLLIMSSVDSAITERAFNAMIAWLRSDFEFGDKSSPQPTATFVNRDGRLYLNIHTYRSAVGIEVYVNYGEPVAFTRSWRRLTTLQKTGEHEYIVPVPVYDDNELTIAYANLIYADKNMASTPVQSVIPARLGAKISEKASGYSRIMLDGQMDISPLISVTKDKVRPDGVICKAKGPFDIVGITAKTGSIVLCRAKHEMNALSRRSALHFDAYSAEGRDLTVRVYVASPEIKQFTAHIHLRGGEFWQKVFLTSADFKSPEGRTLASFADAKIFTIPDVNGTLFNNFVWI